MEARESREQKGGGPIVSVIDDDAAVREALVDLFESASYRTCKFNDAEDFLRSGAVHVSSVLVTDMQLTGIDALTLMNLVAGTRLPVIIITGRPEETLRLRATSKGCAAFLRKPFEPASLLCHVEAALGHA
jgi:FixJ family two-component response regulator